MELPLIVPIIAPAVLVDGKIHQTPLSGNGKAWEELFHWEWSI